MHSVTDTIIDSIKCSFCSDFSPDINNSTEEFLANYPELADHSQVLDKWNSFFLIPDIAPITEDHLLLISKRHVLSMAMLERKEKKELRNIIDNVIDRLKEKHPTSEILVFEHGAGIVDDQVVRCGGCARTDHAHLHFVPIVKTKRARAQSILVYLLNELRSHYRALKGTEIVSLFRNVKTNPYLLISVNSNSYALIPKHTKVPSQILRKLLVREFVETEDRSADPMYWQDTIIFEKDRCLKHLDYSIKTYSKLA